LILNPVYLVYICCSNKIKKFIEMKNVVIAGGTGFVGSYLTEMFRKNGDNVLIISRKEGDVSWNQTDLIKAINGSDLLINLAGRSINCRHNDKNRAEIISSRINGTSALNNAVQQCDNPPKLWINASAIGIYKSTFNVPMTESTTEFATDFMAEVVKKWEETFFSVVIPNTRKVSLRTSVVLGKNGGALSPLLLLTRFGLGGKQGSGKQMFSWIHLEDYFRIVNFVSENTEISGVINCTSPEPVSNQVFMAKLRKEIKVPFGLPAPEFVIKIASKIIGIEPGLILNSQYVYPEKLIKSGFKFKYSTLEEAFSALVK